MDEESKLREEILKQQELISKIEGGMALLSAQHKAAQDSALKLLQDGLAKLREYKPSAESEQKA